MAITRATENPGLLDIETTIELIRAESTPGSFGAKPLVVLTPETQPAET